MVRSTDAVILEAIRSCWGFDSLRQIGQKAGQDQAGDQNAHEDSRIPGKLAPVPETGAFLLCFEPCQLGG